MRRPDFMRKKEERSFKWWLENERKRGGEYEEGALLAEFSVPRLLIEVYPHLTMKDIYDMSWKDVIIRVELAASKIEQMGNAARDANSPFSNIIRNTGVMK